jgi:hypothetical protein
MSFLYQARVPTRLPSFASRRLAESRGTEVRGSAAQYSLFTAPAPAGHRAGSLSAGPRPPLRPQPIRPPDRPPASAAATPPACGSRPGRSRCAASREQRLEALALEYLGDKGAPGNEYGAGEVQRQLHQVHGPRLVHRAIPLILGAMSESTTSTPLPPISGRSLKTVFCKVALNKIDTGNAVHGQDVRGDHPPVIPTSCAATCDQPPGALPRSTTVMPGESAGPAPAVRAACSRRGSDSRHGAPAARRGRRDVRAARPCCWIVS